VSAEDGLTPEEEEALRQRMLAIQAADRAREETAEAERRARERE